MATSVVVSVCWSVFFVALALGSIAGADYVLNHHRAQLHGSYEAFRGPVSYGHIAIGAAVFVASQFVKSPYGRHAQVVDQNKKKRGGAAGKTTAAAAAATDSWAVLPAWVSWIVQESPTLISLLYFAAKSGGASIRANPALLLFGVHYVNRTILFPFFLGNGTPVRVWVCFSALGYCMFNGLLQNGIEEAAAATTTVTFDNMPLAACGAVLFFLGMYGNIAADKYLTSMKQRHKGYVIPQHWVFNSLQISCPNFFCEFVEWVGFAVCTAGCCGIHSSRTLAAASFALFTAANTFPRGMQHHQWYFEKFGEETYGELGRKAVIPFIL